MAYCTQCGATMQAEDQFCGKCGTKVGAPGAPQRTRRATRHKVVGHCDTCHGDWYEGDLKCSTCGGDDYTSIFGAPAGIVDTQADPKNLPISNTLAWIIAVLPLLGLIIENAVAVATGAALSDVWWITLALNVALSWWDASKITPWFPSFNSSWGFLIPVYLYKRAKLLQHSLAYFVTWLVCFAILVFVPSHFLLDNTNFNFGLGSAQTINMVKDGYFDSYPQVPIGKALDAYMEGERWTSFTDDNGVRYVQVEGMISNNEGGTSNLLIQFPIDTVNPSRFSLGAGTINGRTLFTWEVAEHMLSAIESTY